jgi:hypothetical protein
MHGRRPGRKFQICPVEGKRVFDKREAIRVLHRSANHRRDGDGRRQERRVYQCPDCDGWHLTSAPPRQVVA